MLNIVEEELASGVRPDRIAFLTFTKKAANEAAERAMARFGMSRRELPYFSTIHSLCWKRLGMQSQDLMQNSDWKTLGDLLGLDFGKSYNSADGLFIAQPGDGSALKNVAAFADATCTPLRDVWENYTEDVDWFQLKQYADTLTAYKQDMGKRDYHEMLYDYWKKGDPLDIDVGIVDEGQDLSKMQWMAAHRAIGEAERLYVAGDDDQAIYRWNGADVDYFLNLKYEREVLPVSHRLPQSVFDLANTITDQIHKRYPKDWESTGKPGSVEWIKSIEEMSYEDGTWMLLARNNSMLRPMINTMRSLGYTYHAFGKDSVDEKHLLGIRVWTKLQKGKSVTGAQAQVLQEYVPTFPTSLLDPERNYDARMLLQETGVEIAGDWHDRLTGISDYHTEYYLSVLRNKQSLVDPPRITISSIHGVKGGEADNVVMLTDMSRRAHETLCRSPDDEHRVFYTGVTRARENLFIHMPTTTRYYTI